MQKSFFCINHSLVSIVHGMSVQKILKSLLPLLRTLSIARFSAIAIRFLEKGGALT